MLGHHLQSTTVFVTVCNRDGDPMEQSDEGADGAAVTQSDVLKKSPEWQPVIGGMHCLAAGHVPENDLVHDEPTYPTETADPGLVAAASGAGGMGAGLVRAPAATAPAVFTRASMLREQTDKGISELLGCLYVAEHRLSADQKQKFVAVLRRTTQFAPVCHYMHLLMQRRAVPRAGKAAIANVLYVIGRALLPERIPDNEVFEHGRQIIGYLLLLAQEDIIVVRPDTQPVKLFDHDSMQFVRYPVGCTDGGSCMQLSDLHCNITGERLVDPFLVLPRVPEDADLSKLEKGVKPKALGAAAVQAHKGKAYTRQAALA